MKKHKKFLNCVKDEDYLIKNASIIYNFKLFKYIASHLEQINKNITNYNQIYNKFIIKDCFNFIKKCFIN